jgi:hypothetical protein
MIEIIREFIVREEARGQFELLYGPGGAWSSLFTQCLGFRGTTLLRDIKNQRRYLAVDFWEAEGQRERALADHGTEYSKLEAAFAEWTESKVEAGSFRVLAEATVRSHGRAGQADGGGSGRRSRRTTR